MKMRKCKMIKWVAEWLIDCVVVMFLIVLGLFIVGIDEEVQDD
nr:MAG TPA: hypothetical protein [Caudoviricetes sp.]